MEIAAVAEQEQPRAQVAPVGEEATMDTDSALVRSPIYAPLTASKFCEAYWRTKFQLSPINDAILIPYELMFSRTIFFIATANGPTRLLVVCVQRLLCAENVSIIPCAEFLTSQT